MFDVNGVDFLTIHIFFVLQISFRHGDDNKLDTVSKKASDENETKIL